MNDACWFICRWTQGIGRTTKATKAPTQKSYQLLNSSWMHNRQHRRIWNVWKTERSSSYPTDHALTNKRWKRGIWSVGEPKCQRFGETQVVCWFCLNFWKLEVTRTFSLEKLVHHLLVRGTISFYNQKRQLFPAGESEMWNVSMWLNEQCWRGTISFSVVFH